MHRTNKQEIAVLRDLNNNAPPELLNNVRIFEFMPILLYRVFHYERRRLIYKNLLNASF